MKKNKLKILIGAFFFLGFKFSFSQDVSYNDSCGNFIIKHKVPLIKEYAKYKYLPFYILTPSVEFEFSHFDNKDTFVNLSYHRECEYNSNLKINEINLDLLDNFKYNFSNQNELYSVNINCPDSHTLFNHIVFLATIKTLKQSSIFLNKGVKIPEEISNLKQLEYLNIRYACDNPSFVLD